VADNLRRLGLDVALALLEPGWIVGVALALDHRREHELIALAFDRDGFIVADVERPRPRDRLLLADETLHRQFQPQLVARERDLWAGLGVADERHLIERAELIEELRRRGQHGTQRARPDVDLIDRDHNRAAVGRRHVRRVERLALVLDLLLRRRDVHLHELGGHDAPHFAVDLHGKLRGVEIFNGMAVAIDHRHVDRDQIDPGAKRRTLNRLGVGRCRSVWRGPCRLL
jgi:hypothetical protein